MSKTRYVAIYIPAYEICVNQTPIPEIILIQRGGRLGSSAIMNWQAGLDISWKWNCQLFSFCFFDFDCVFSTLFICIPFCILSAYMFVCFWSVTFEENCSCMCAMSSCPSSPSHTFHYLAPTELSSTKQFKNRSVSEETSNWNGCFRWKCCQRGCWSWDLQERRQQNDDLLLGENAHRTLWNPQVAAQCDFRCCAFVCLENSFSACSW